MDAEVKETLHCLCCWQQFLRTRRQVFPPIDIQEFAAFMQHIQIAWPRVLKPFVNQAGMLKPDCKEVQVYNREATGLIKLLQGNTPIARLWPVDISKAFIWLPFQLTAPLVEL